MEAQGKDVILNGIINLSKRRRFLGHPASRFVRAWITRVRDDEVRVGEVGVGETEAELVTRFDAGRVEVAVVDEVAFLEVQLWWVGARCVDDVDAPILSLLSPCEDGFRTGVRLTVEHVGDGVSGFLAGQAGPEESCDVRVVLECFDDDGAGGVQHDDGVGVDTRDMSDQFVAAVPEGQVISITLVPPRL